ncbi:hypothetical protein F8388_013754 [Cannabis sativa]|uniref:Uncharacterized protein n=1 Tax=Cannabis sativa TaxID=3483 RepID=A0A7J6G3H4_CANSA|nr:hypothetical protein F8388_013754 [Cannabis sativa]
MEELQELNYKTQVLLEKLDKSTKQFFDELIGCFDLEDTSIQPRIEAKLESFVKEIEIINKETNDLKQIFIANLDKIDFSIFLQSFSEPEHKEILSKYEALMNVINAKNNGRSWMELVQEQDQKSDGHGTEFSSIRAVAIDVGIQISVFLAQYFFLLAEELDQEVMGSKIRSVKSSIRSEITEKKSSTAITDRFVSVINILEEAMEFYYMKNNTMESGFIGETGDDVLGMILLEVSNLERAIFTRLFPDWFNSMKAIEAVERGMKKSFSSKLNEIGWKIQELKKKMKENNEELGTVHHEDWNLKFKEILDFKIPAIWRTLDLNVKTTNGKNKGSEDETENHQTRPKSSLI